MYTWIALSSKDDLTGLAATIPSEYDPKRVIEKLKDGISGAVKAILVEKNYIDKDYRSTYYNFYAKKGRLYSSNCVRLHFFDETVQFNPRAYKLTCPDGKLEDHYFGYIVLRPTGLATIGRSVLSPNVRMGATGFLIQAEHKVHLLGYKLKVQGFPSMDQHHDISVCAHVACWSILRHYSEKYSTYREFLTHDITLMAQQFNPGGLVPSRGLEVSHAERVFQEAGTFPFLVPRAGSTDPAFYRQLHAYIESGFPLFAAMSSREHAVAVIGYQWQPHCKRTSNMRYAWDQVKSLIVVDDNYLPYLSVPVQGGSPYSAYDINAFIVALPEKVFYPADAVDKLSSVLFKMEKLLELPRENETILRYFITTGSALRRFIREKESEFDPKLIETVMALPLAQFVWIIELATSDDWSRGQISARAVLDATASLREVMPFWLFHNRKRALVFDRNKVDTNVNGILELSGMEKTALSRWDQNLRPVQSK